MDPRPDHADADVAILGGGLAGLCLAIQLRRAAPELAVVVLEQASFPVREAAHKVGESTVEVGARYFTETVGVADHIAAEQLPKLGLRYFFGDGTLDMAQRLELGGNRFLPVKSWQLDRGRFENHLAARARALGVDLRDGWRVSGVEIGVGEEAHRVEGGGGAVVRCRWLIDASGRAAVLKRRLGLRATTDHDVNAAWFRVPGRIRVDDWSQDPAWRARNPAGERWLSTNHLMGPGYWVWLIPLASGQTSVGIVADQALHPWPQLGRPDRARAWLERHEPACAAAVSQAGPLLDFLALRHFSHDATRLFDGRDRWALVGEAGAFLDPFYSPGSDFIAYANTFVVDLVLRDHAGEPVAGRATFHERIFRTFFANSLNLYQGQYPLFGDGRVMSHKILWDFAWYWAVPAAFLFHDRLTDLRAFADRQDALARAADLNQRVQALFRSWHAAGPSPVGAGFVDVPGVPFMRDLNTRLLEPCADRQAFLARLDRDLALLERIAGSVAARVRREHPGLAPEREWPTAEEALLTSVALA